MATWTKTNDYYNRNVVKEDVWSRKCRKGKIYLIDNTGSFTFTFSCGSDSDYSFTGSFYGCSKMQSVNQAMAVIDKIAPLWFNDKSYQHIIKKYE